MKQIYRVRILPLLLILIGVPLIVFILILGILNAYDAPIGAAVEQAFSNSPYDETIQATRLALAVPLRIIFILLIFFLALVIQQMSTQLAGGVLRIQRKIVAMISAEPDAANEHAWVSHWSPQRVVTVQRMFAGIIGFLAFSTAIYLSVSQFIEFGGLAIFATVISTALGYASRDYIGDLLAGISNLFEDNLDVGEKIEVKRINNPMQGVVQMVSLRRALLETPLGDRLMIPHGDIRVFRNFSRAAHSGTRIAIHVAAADLGRAVELITTTTPPHDDLPDLLAPWRVVCVDGKLGETVTLEIVAKAPFGRGVALRFQMLTFLERTLRANNISLNVQLD